MRAASSEARDGGAAATGGSDAGDDGVDNGNGGDDGDEAGNGSVAMAGGGDDSGGEPAKRQRGDKGKRKGGNARRWNAAKGR